MELVGLYIWRNTVSLGYFPLESFLSTQSLVDRSLICVDPDSDPETLLLTERLAQRDGVEVLEYVWPNSSPDGSAIGEASNAALDHIRDQNLWVVNVQADEVYHPNLVAGLREHWEKVASVGVQGIRLKVLHTEYNAQEYQGGDEFDGRGTPKWEWQSGAGYNKAMKLVRPDDGGKIRFSHDAWSFDNVSLYHHYSGSDMWPVMHLHNFFRDSLVALRRNAADSFWTDAERFGHYKTTADEIEKTKEQWWGDPKWTSRKTPFEEFLPQIVLSLVGETSYGVRWGLLDD
jgi:hypothetical protein